MTTPYIVLEGIDGCGKDSHAAQLRSHFQHRGMTPLVVNEPCDLYEHGRLLRKMLQTGTFVEAHVAMFLADRMSLLTREVKPALEAGRPVISARSFCSTLVYQQENWPLNWLFSIHEMLPAKPTHIFILDIPAEEAVNRIHQRSKGEGTIVEHYEKKDILERARQRYLALVKDPRMKNFLADGGGIHVVDSTGSPSEVHRNIEELL